MPRLFTGLETSGEAALRLSSMRGGLEGARWIDPSDYHVTLSFAGDISQGAARALEAELAEIDGPVLRLRISSLSAFGGARPKAIIAVVDPSAALLALQSDSDRALRRAGILPERRNYFPHVTIARLTGASASAVAAFLGERYVAPFEFTARRFILYSARVSRGGGPYVVEAAYPLR